MLTTPLMVRLLGRAGPINISPRLIEDLQYGNAAPGGYTSAQCQLSRPLDRAGIELSPFTAFEVVDTSSGEQLWFGRLEDPGKASGNQVWNLAATGNAAHAQDLQKPVAYCDTRMGEWKPFQPELKSGGDAQVGPSDGTTLYTGAVMTAGWPKGAQVTNTRRIQMQLHTFVPSDQHIAAAMVTVTAASAGGGNWFIDFVGRGGPAADTILATLTPSTPGAVNLVADLPTNYSTLHTIIEVRLRWSGAATTIAVDNIYAQLQNLSAQGTRMDRFGVEITTAGGYSGLAGGPYPHQVVEDVLGRFLPVYDKNAANVDTTINQRISQMTYEDTTTASEVLEDLMTMFPTHYWAVWGGDPVAQYQLPGYVGLGGAQFEWKPWPTTIALEGLDTELDVFDDSGSAADLYNEVMVRYVDAVGRSFTTLRTSTSPALTAAGLTRRAFIDLGSQLGNLAQSQLVGDNFLAAHQYPSNGGTIKVRRPLRDATTGRLLRPRELRAGVLCRVGNLAPQPDPLNSASSNGSTVFRVSTVSYSAKSDEATLTLDSYSRSLARQLAGLSRRAQRTRRL